MNVDNKYNIQIYNITSLINSKDLGNSITITVTTTVIAITAIITIIILIRTIITITIITIKNATI